MRRMLIVLIAVLLLPRCAAAQDTPRFGVAMGYPAEVGVLWTVSDRLAVRPELNWTRTTTETTTIQTIFSVNGGVTTNSVTTKTTTMTTGTGVSALIYVARREALRTYLVPRFSYARGSSDTDPGLSLPVGVTPTSTTTSSYGASGAIGAQYAVATHFGIFGELGIAYTRNTLSFSPSSLPRDAKNTTTGIRSGVGVILFFGS
ncbi:MAG TPA: hypothetical protein VKD69_25920 [Vicinamibacterales bacterium]|nr:hypothetical protein [Vicinamibacterales bacterium]